MILRYQVAMTETRPRKFLSKVVCLAIISPMLLAALAYIALAAFWWSGDSDLASARSNNEALKTRLKTGNAMIRAGEVAAAIGLPARACVCISTPYANPGSSFVVGNHDITGSFGSELTNEGIFAVMSVDPEAQGAVERLPVSHGRVDFSLALADVPKPISGVWCGPSESTGSVLVDGDRWIITFNSLHLSTNACKVTATE